MSILGSILQIGASGLRTHQQALNVTAHNLANASTEGYSRQRAVIAAARPVHLSEGVFGQGTEVVDVERVRDRLLDGAYWREVSLAGDFEARASMLARVEELMQEPSEEGLAAALEQFHLAWSELGAHPSSSSVRSVLRQSAATLVSRFRELASGLDAIRQEVEARAREGVDAANALAARIADLNRAIASSEADGHTAGDLRDARDLAVGELATLLPVHAIEREDGTVGVSVSGVSLVDGPVAARLEIVASGGAWALGVVGRATTVPASSGTLGGHLTLLSGTLADVRARLDALAGALVDDVNGLHRMGTNPLGDTDVAFFDPAGTSASTIALSAAVTADARAIAAGTADAGGAYRAGANDVALLLSGLRDQDLGTLGVSGAEHWRGLVSDVGQAVRSFDEAAASHRILAEQADVRRMRVSGVSVDEELVSMIEFQRAYQASARIVTAADEMLETLLAM